MSSSDVSRLLPLAPLDKHWTIASLVPYRASFSFFVFTEITITGYCRCACEMCLSVSFNNIAPIVRLDMCIARCLLIISVRIWKWKGSSRRRFSCYFQIFRVRFIDYKL
jgi:hypothetical protein